MEDQSRALEFSLRRFLKFHYRENRSALITSGGDLNLPRFEGTCPTVHEQGLREPHASE